jgi:Rps23 Pro-64 3,4-dihydroxylase Tpa1-like proline 4-hydroxylase
MNIINRKYNELHEYSIEFINAKPYPHIILDNFLDETFFSQLDIDNFSKDPGKGITFDTDLEKNKWTSKNDKLSNNLKLIVDKLNSSEFINNLQSLSKIEELFSTTAGNTALANYHEMYQSGFLGTHVDHSSEPNTGLPHVLNIILYLSKNWDKKWGGETVLANDDGTKILKSIEYIPNRAVIFLHSPFTFHGVTKILDNLTKRSTIYVDYYSKNFSPYKHLKLDFKNIWFKHPTTFILHNFKDYFLTKNRKYLKKMIKHRIKAFLA